MSKFFISYSHHDQKFAQKLRKDILQVDDAHKVFMDRFDLHVGAALKSALADHVNESDYYILLLTEHSQKSTWVQKELAQAKKSESETGQKKIFMVIPPGSQASVPRKFKNYLAFRFDKIGSYTADFCRLMRGLTAKPSFYKVCHTVRSDVEGGYLIDFWIEAEKPEYMERVEIVDYRFDYGFIDSEYNAHLESAVHYEKSVEKNFKVKDVWTNESIVVFVSIYLNNTSTIYFVEYVNVG